MKRVSVLAALALALCVGVPSVAAAPAKAARAVHTSAAPGVTVRSFTADSLGDEALLQGEVQNTFLAPVDRVVVTTTVYDSAGKVVAREVGLPMAEPIDPGATQPFVALLHHTGARYDVRVSAFQPALQAPNRNVKVTYQGANPDENGELHVTGTVQNTNTTPTGIAVWFVFYDAAGKVVGADIELVNDLDDVAAGASAPFTYDNPYPPEFSTLSAIAEGTSMPATGTELLPVLPRAAGSTAQLEGTAKPGDAITFEQCTGIGPDGNPVWTSISGMTATADATTGEFAATFKVTGPAYVRAVAGSATSPGIGIVVVASATFKASATSVKKAAKVTLSGTVTPGTAGTVVTIQRKVGSKWTALATVKLSASGAFTYAWVPKAAGTYVLRASVPTTGLIQAAVSASKTIKVK